ncbi:MAG TPA: hypothetical protein VGW77_15270 [Candidatus Binatia bacterium]|jgi:hypothetical protein|nr:hypothetical protein [Candidatus Binatia bacterium]
MNPKPQHIEVITAPNPPKQTGMVVALCTGRSKNFNGRISMHSDKLRRFLAVSAMAFFLGASSAQAQVSIIGDSDGDGVQDIEDQCSNSDLSATVFINGVNTGIQNTGANPAGCTFADLVQEMIDECLDDAKNHGQFVSCVSHETNILKRAKTITGKQKGKIQSIVAKMQ